MKNVIVAGVVALALVACGAKEEAVAPEAAPAVEATESVEAAPAETGGVPVDTGAEVVTAQ